MIRRLLGCALLVLAVPLPAQVVGVCSRYVDRARPTATAGCACYGRPAIGRSLDLWYPSVSISMPPPTPTQVMFFGAADPGFSFRWQGVAISGWRPDFQLGMRLLQTSNCSIPLHSCVMDAAVAVTLTIPNDPALIGSRWRAGVIDLFDLAGVAAFPTHDPSLDVELVVGAQ